METSTMSNTSQHPNQFNQPATAGFQPDSMGLQSPTNGNVFNDAMPANGMASQSGGTPNALNISANAESTQIDVSFAGDDSQALDAINMRLEGLGLGNPRQWAEGLQQVGQNVSNWLQRFSQAAIGPGPGMDQDTMDSGGQVTTSDPQNSDSSKTLVGVIDTGFGANEHGSEVLNTIQDGEHDATFWQGGGIGEGTWADSLNEFVDVARASGNPRAVANLSFDLTQVNPDGSVSTRYQLTAQEQAALDYAAENDVLVVAAAGNQGEIMSALGLASQQYDNVIAVGAAQGDDRATYSSYGPGLDFLANGGGEVTKGTSFAAANVTDTITDVWAANPNLSSEQVVRTLEGAAVDLHAPGRDLKTGLGRIDSQTAVDFATQSTGNLQEGNHAIAGFPEQPINNFTANSDLLNHGIPGMRPASVALPDGMKPKDETVNIDNLVPEMQAILPDIAQAYEDSGTGFSPHISSGNDSTHSPGSAHYKDMAIDLSSHDTDYSDYMTADEVKAIAREITDAPLEHTPVSGDENRMQSNWDRDRDGTRDYTVIVEHPGIRGKQHIHIELEPENSISPSAITSPEFSSDSGTETNLELTSFSGSPLQYKENQALERDERVYAWQKRMQERGWNIEADGFYGPESKGIATQFQIEKNLGVDGIVGSETWDTAFADNNITPSFPGELFEYTNDQTLDYDPNVEVWQERMQERGWDIAADGFYGQDSQRIATQFQREKRLQIDGIVGPETWHAAFDDSNVTSSSQPEFATDISSPNILSTEFSPDPQNPQYSGEMTFSDELSPNMRAFLDTISYAEGTYDPEGYRIRFGGETFDSFDAHPRIHEPFGNTTSTAAGRYQFLERTWNGIQDKLGLPDFSPESQDAAAVEKIKERGAYNFVESGQFERAINELNKEWASFPGSPYGQPTRAMGDLQRFYEARLETYKNSDESTPSVEDAFLNASESTGIQTAIPVSDSFPTTQSEKLLRVGLGTPAAPDPDVQAWQNFLQANGNPDLVVDGAFGRNTEAATEEFQRANNLPQDGIVGSDTYDAAQNAGFMNPGNIVQDNSSQSESYEQRSRDQYRSENYSFTDQIQDIEQQINNESENNYDAHEVAQILRRKTESKYNTTAHDAITNWNENDGISSRQNIFTYDVELPNQIEFPSGHFLSALSFQFGQLVNSPLSILVEPSDNSYGGDLGSVVGAMLNPGDWMDDSTASILEDIKEPIDRLEEAFSRLAPPAQLDANIAAHVVGDLVRSEDMTISGAISVMGNMSKRDVYDAFTKTEFGISLSDLNNPLKSEKFHEARSQIEDSISNFLNRSIAKDGFDLYRANPDLSVVSKVADHFLEYLTKL
jgi:muramidase (phage lysozyme)/peptidoglycan hydrolase-like protein with peptidoglycan-binding domain